MVRTTRIVRYIILLLIITVLSSIFFFNKPTSNLSEDANPSNQKDAKGNTKAPDLAPGVAQVIDTHRVATQKQLTFPLKIHQTAQKQEATPASLSWYYANPGEEHVFYNDKEARQYVRSTADPESARLYTQLSSPVARADLFRYIVLRNIGGVYSDIDTTTLCPLSAWIPSQFEESRINLVIGIEVDEPSITSQAQIDKWGWASNFQFVQWTIMARPGHKVFEMTLKEVSERVKALAEQKGTTVSDLEMTGLEIIKATGPGAFTTAVLNYLDLKDPVSLRALTSPIQLKDILVMPVTSFAPNQRHSKSKSVKFLENIPEVLVMHGFQATRTWANSLKVWLLTAAAKAKFV